MPVGLVTVAGLAANIIQLTDAAAKVIKYINGVKNAPRDQAALAKEVSSLLFLLIHLRERVEESKSTDPWFSGACSLGAEGGPIDQIKTELDGLMRKLKPETGIKRLGKVLVWTFDKNEIRATLLKIQRMSTLVNLALQGDHIKLSLAIADSIAEVKSDLRKTVETAEGSRDRKVLQWLSPLDSQEKQGDIFAQRSPGTGNWFLDLKEFKSWRDADITKPSTLWCPGIPGAGKTVMMSTVVNHLKETYRNKDIAVAFVYCGYKDFESQTASNLIPSLVQQFVRQLIQGGGSIPDEVSTAFSNHDHGKRLRLEESTKLLQSLSTRFRRTFILVDALDECSSDNQAGRSHQQVLLDALLELHGLKNGCSLFITSRMNGNIGGKLAPYTRIEIRATDADIESYIRARIYNSETSRLAEHARRAPELGKTIIAKLVENAQGMFLLPRLHLDMLQHQTSIRHLREALDDLPTELNDIYDNAMTRIEGQPRADYALALQTLSWISHALQPLRVSELQHALAVEPGDQELDREGVPFTNLLVSVCSGLISVDAESGTVSLVHFTVEEYFKKTRQKWFPDAAVTMAKICLTYMSFNDFANGSCNTDRELDERLRDYPFLQYAAKNWGIHAHGTAELAVKEMAQGLLENGSKLSSAIQVRDCPLHRYAGFSQRFTKGVTGLHVASDFGLTEIVNLLLKRGADIEACDQNGWTALHWAAKHGHEAVVLLLLEKRDKIGCKHDEAVWTALHWAAKNGHELVVRLLIKRGANVRDAWDEGGWTALHWAVVNEHEAMVQLLLEEGADVDGLSWQPVTPLHWAAKSRSRAVVQLLLDRGAEIDAKDKDGRTPLHRAAENGHEPVIRLLVEKGADVMAKDNYGRTVLRMAEWHGNEAAVQLLLEKRASPMAQNE